LKLSADDTVHHGTCTIKKLPKKDQEQTTKYAPIAQDILSFTYSIANLEPRAKKLTVKLISHFTHQANHKGIFFSTVQDRHFQLSQTTL
jgi:hypothetical protein